MNFVDIGNKQKINVKHKTKPKSVDAWAYNAYNNSNQ